jgi:hypothetical protein
MGRKFKKRKFIEIKNDSDDLKKLEQISEAIFQILQKKHSLSDVDDYKKDANALNKTIISMLDLNFNSNDNVNKIIKSLEIHGIKWYKFYQKELSFFEKIKFALTFFFDNIEYKRKFLVLFKKKHEIALSQQHLVEEVEKKFNDKINDKPFYKKSKYRSIFGVALAASTLIFYCAAIPLSICVPVASVFLFAGIFSASLVNIKIGLTCAFASVLCLKLLDIASSSRNYITQKCKKVFNDEYKLRKTRPMIAYLNHLFDKQ